MDAPASHPSFLELDRLHLGSAAPGVQAHVDGCESCRAHLRSLDQPVAVPAWATELGREAPSTWRVWENWRDAMQVLVPVALAATVLAVVIPAHGPLPVIAEREIEEKGSPSLALYVKRGTEVLAWEGQLVQPGDRLQLQVASAGFRFVTVTAGAPDGASLYAGAIDPTRPVFVPESWAVDAEPGAEKLVVLLSQKALAPAEITRATTGNRRDAEVWVSKLTLHKSEPATEPKR